ncbi:small membrane protein YmiC [Cedecea sp. FDAARGOS_727]|nr:small membrane protein YmiC [Cedecea sp. FDAARGOS_727]
MNSRCGTKYWAWLGVFLLSSLFWLELFRIFTN